MKQTRHDKWASYSGQAGVNRDVHPEKLKTQEGFIADSCNTRPTSLDGNTGGRESIGGEEIEYPNIDNRCGSGTGAPIEGQYRCIGVARVNNQKLEFWADEDDVKPPILRLDGDIVAQSSDIPLSGKRDLQIGIDENCSGGEVYITDHNSPPMIFNLQDLTDNKCGAKYFEDFNPQSHLLILESVSHRPVFDSLTTGSDADHVFTPVDPVGLPVGLYTYSVRYSITDGDKTGWSAPTPQIPVVRNDSSEVEDIFPRSRTRGDDANISAPTSYGIKLRVRVENKLGFDFVQVRRTRWNLEDPFGTAPVMEICGSFNITAGEVSVHTFIDKNGFQEALGSDEIGEVMGAIEKCKTLRYTNKRLWLGNITYASRVLDASSIVIETFDNGDKLIPVMERLGVEGHGNPYNFTYYRDFMASEKYGFAMVLWDGQSFYSYPLAIEGAENFEMPAYRDVLADEGLELSYNSGGGNTRNATNAGTVDYTFERTDMDDAVVKPDTCQWHNIMDDGSARRAKSNIEEDLHGILDCEVPGDYLNSVNQATGEKIGWAPFTPTSQADDDTDGLSFRVNLRVGEFGDGGAFEEFNPKGFGVAYHTQGVAVKSVTNLPSWAKAISIVRTRPANKVMCSGLAFYRLQSAGSGLGANTSKYLNRIHFFSPDTATSQGIDSAIMPLIIANPERYAVQVQKPLGFFSEVWSFLNETNTPNGGIANDSGIDMMCYARIQKGMELADINPFDTSDMGIDDDSVGYVGFGSWRRSGVETNGTFVNGTNPTIDTPIDITSVTNSDDTESRGVYQEIVLESNIFYHGAAGGQQAGTTDGVKQWHEPVYIVNIIDKQASVPTQNTTEYFFTGHYQKIESLIGVSTGLSDQTFELVDERWEDCVNYLSDIIDTSSQYTELEKFVWVENEQGTKQRWLNVTNKNDGARIVILEEILNVGYAIVSDLSGDYQVYGVYTTGEVSRTPLMINVVFEHFNTDYAITSFVPADGRGIYVMYDDRIPMRVFGGDCSSGESIFAPIDIQYDSSGVPASQFKLNVAFPNLKFDLNPFQFIVNKTTGLNKIQDTMLCKLDNDFGTSPAFIRQLCVMFPVQSRIVTNFAFNSETTKESSNQFYPLKNYVMRPYKWNNDQSPADQNIFSQYVETYGDEKSLWGYGGFRFLQQTNIDYSKAQEEDQHFISVPITGFNEQKEFCNRIVWSEEREPNVQNSPSVRTFPELNFYDISDDTGEINFLWSTFEADKAYNLYAFTERGINLLLVDKRTIHEISGNELATVGSDIGGILNDVWLSKTVGIPDEMWRTASEHGNLLFFVNKQSGWVFDGAKAVDVMTGKYKSLVLNRVLKVIADGFGDHVATVYDIEHKEWWVTFLRSPRGRYNFLEATVGTSPLYINSAEHEDEIPVENYDYGTSVDVPEGIGNAVMLSATVPTNEQLGVLLGGATYWLLRQDVVICVSPSSEYAVLIKWKQLINGAETSQSISLLPGSCMKFTHSFYETTPWLIPRVSFIATSLDLTTDIEDFFKGDCQTIVFQLDPHANEQEPSNGQWQGRYAYRFDKYLCMDDAVYGMRNLETYKLNEGFIINGATLQPVITGVCNTAPEWDKEFFMQRTNSNVRPRAIRFYKTLADVDDENAFCEILGTEMKNYEGFESYIKRNSTKTALTGRFVYWQVIHTLAEKFVHLKTLIQTKTLN